MAYEAAKIKKYPLLDDNVSVATAGKNFVWYIDHDSKWNKIGGQRDVNLSISVDSIEVNEKANNGWGSSIPGLRSWSASPEILCTDSNAGLKILRDWSFNDDLQLARKAIHICFVDESAGEYYESWCTIGSYEISGPTDGEMTVSLELNGICAINIGEDFVADTTGGGTIKPALGEYEA